MCEIETPECLVEPIVVLADIEHQEICMYDNTPITIGTTGMKTDSVEFVIHNTWPNDISALSVHFINAEGEPQCDTFDDMQGFLATSQIEAFCSAGIAEVGIHIYSSDIDYVSGILPATCNAPSSMGICSYNFVLPCVVDLDCVDTVPTDAPSLPPPTTAPLDCVALSNPIWHETTGNTDFPYKETSVTILEQNVDEVKFTISQLWNKVGVPMFAVMYRSINGDEQCEMKTRDDDGTLIPYDTTEVYTSQCNDGYAEIAVYVYVGSDATFDPEECEACSVPDDNYVAYVMSLPCIPVCKPEPPEKCIEEPLLVLADIGHDVMCIYDERPIQSDVTSIMDDSVEFTISNTWPKGIDELSISYTNSRGDNQCQTRGVDGFETATPIRTYCVNGLAEIIVQVHSKVIHHAATKVLDGCETPEDMGTCSYGKFSSCFR